MPRAVGGAGGGGGGGAKGGKKKLYDRAEVFSINEILTDNCNKKWKLGKSIGSGGFGDIYLASDDTAKPVTEKTAQYVIKIEPHSNGPLFCEVNFYLRAAKTEMIEEWKQKNKIDNLGMPPYIGSGSHDYKNTKYRFMVIPRYGQDLHKIIGTKPGKRLSCRSIQAAALQTIDVLEYIHSREFVHADIKASNLLLGLGKKEQLYLLDYGLAAKFKHPNGEHIKYGPDLRKAHNGTLEYTSRDAHIGAFSCRGDLEILGYNMLEWLTGFLPWNKNESPDAISKQKNLFMGNPSLKKYYPGDTIGLDLIEKYLKYVAGLKFEDKPNYNHCRDILRRGLPKTLNSLFFDDVNVPPTPKKKSLKRLSTAAAASPKSPYAGAKNSLDTVDYHQSPPKKIKLPEDTSSAKRSTRTTKRVQKNFNWTRVLSSNPEKIIHQTQSNGSTPSEVKIKKSPPVAGPLTPAMLQILSKRKENNPLPRTHTKNTDLVEGTNQLTPAMKEILLKTKKKKLRKSLAPGPNDVVKKLKQKAVVVASAAAGKSTMSSNQLPINRGINFPPPLPTGITSRSARHLRRNPCP